MRRLIGVATACGALTITAVVPASAENLASQEVANAYSIMMTNSEGRSVIGGKNMIRQFAVFSAESGAADDPWLCDLTGVGGRARTGPTYRCPGRTRFP
jgi:hypothetical protein